MSLASVIVAEGQRLLARRMTRFFPLVLAALMVVGVVIAFFVVGDEGPDFVDDVAGGRFSSGPEDENTIGVLGPMGFLIPIMSFVIGASFFGADQKSGMIEQLLTWEPRRWRLIVGRLIAGLVVLFVIATILSALLVVLIFGLSSITGTTDGTGDIVPAIIGAVVRSGAVGALFFAIGFSATVLVNNSIAAIVGFLIWAFVVENLFLGFVPSVGRFLPMNNAGAFVERGSVLRDSPFDFPTGLSNISHGWVVAGLLVAGLAVLASGVAALLFGRRDIA